MLKESRYNVLIVSTNDKFNNAISKILLTSDFNIIEFAFSSSQAKRLLIERNFDIVIVNSPIADENGINFSISILDRYNLGVLLLVDSHYYNEAFDKTHEFGILTLGKPVDRDLFMQSLRILCTTREKYDKIKSYSKSVSSLKEKMEQIKMVNEAKILLMKNLKIDEENAHKMIERKAMDNRVPKYMIANEIITRYRK